MSDLPACACSGPGFCQRFQRQQGRRTWELCSGQCPPERPCPDEGRRAEYLARWARELGEACETVPSALKRLANAGKAAMRVAQQGFVRVPLEVYAERRARCDACELREAATDRCKHPNCGCELSARRILLGTVNQPGKLELGTESCPMGKWAQAVCNAT